MRAASFVLITIGLLVLRIAIIGIPISIFNK